MTDLITFTQTSDEPYLRHDYKIHFLNKKTRLFDNYQDVMQTWFETASELLDYVEILDHKEKARGF
jgi:hypothetical protein